jgi:predicted transcriptional regulator
LLEFVDANKTLSTAKEIEFTVTAIIEDYPAMSIEEVILVFSRIKKGEYGKYYERFKTPEILEAIRLYESEDRAEMLEKHNQRYKLEEMSKSNEDVANNETALHYLKKWKENALKAKMVDISKEVKKIQDHKQRLSFFEDNELQFKLVCEKVNEGFDLTNEEKVFMNKCGINIL